MVKYDGFDCVYGIELFKDERVSNLQVLSEKVGELGEASALLWSIHVLDSEVNEDKQFSDNKGDIHFLQQLDYSSIVSLQ